MATDATYNRPDRKHFLATADAQQRSTFFGELPLEIRDMIYAEFWAVSGHRQHVFPVDDSSGDGVRSRRLAHFPCVLGHERRGCAESKTGVGRGEAGRDDGRRRYSNSGSTRSSHEADDDDGDRWARRMASTWNDHWECEEEMFAHAASPDGRGGKARQTLFLPVLLTCKKIYLESLPSLYATTTLVLTDLPTAHRVLVSPRTRLPWRAAASRLPSLALSLRLPYHTLHRHRYDSTAPADQGPWAELCVRLSDMARFGALGEVVLRLALAPDEDEQQPGEEDRHHSGEGVGGGGAVVCCAGAERQWWQVRERWVLSAVRGTLARRMTVQLPELTAGVDWLRPYQYREGGYDEVGGGADHDGEGAAAGNDDDDDDDDVGDNGEGRRRRRRGEMAQPPLSPCPFRLERYPQSQLPRRDSQRRRRGGAGLSADSSGATSARPRTESRETPLRKARRSIAGLVAGVKGA